MRQWFASQSSVTVSTTCPASERMLVAPADRRLARPMPGSTAADAAGRSPCERTSTTIRPVAPSHCSGDGCSGAVADRIGEAFGEHVDHPVASLGFGGEQAPDRVVDLRGDLKGRPPHRDHAFDAVSGIRLLGPRAGREFALDGGHRPGDDLRRRTVAGARPVAVAQREGGGDQLGLHGRVEELGHPPARLGEPALGPCGEVDLVAQGGRKLVLVGPQLHGHRTDERDHDGDERVAGEFGPVELRSEAVQVEGCSGLACGEEGDTEIARDQGGYPRGGRPDPRGEFAGDRVAQEVHGADDRRLQDCHLDSVGRQEVREDEHQVDPGESEGRSRAEPRRDPSQPRADPEVRRLAGCRDAGFLVVEQRVAGGTHDVVGDATEHSRRSIRIGVVGPRRDGRVDAVDDRRGVFGLQVVDPAVGIRTPFCDGGARRQEAPLHVAVLTEHMDDHGDQRQQHDRAHEVDGRAGHEVARHHVDTEGGREEDDQQRPGETDGCERDEGGDTAVPAEPGTEDGEPEDEQDEAQDDVHRQGHEEATVAGVGVLDELVAGHHGDGEGKGQQPRPDADGIIAEGA